MIWLSLLAILGAYAPVLKSFPSCLSTRGVAAPAGHPVLLGTRLTACLVRDGGAPHATQSPRDLASCRFAWAWRSLFSLRSGLLALFSSYSCRFCFLASTSAGVGSTRGFGFFTFWLALAAFLLDLGLFGVRMTKVLSKMRFLETPAWAVAWRENPRSPRLLHS